MKNALKEDLAMKKKIMRIPLLLLLIGCSQKVTEEDLIGGKWIGTAGYVDGKAEDEPNCYPFQDGIEFKDDDTVYVETYERDFEYLLNKKGVELALFDISRSYSYQIKKVDEDELALERLGVSEDNTCILERK